MNDALGEPQSVLVLGGTSEIALEARNQNLLNYAPDVREHMEKYRKKTTG